MDLKQKLGLVLIYTVFYSQLYIVNMHKLLFAGSVRKFALCALCNFLVVSCRNDNHIKTESTRKLSNFNFQWTKTLYQKNLKNITFFFYIFQGLKR